MEVIRLARPTGLAGVLFSKDFANAQSFQYILTYLRTILKQVIGVFNCVINVINVNGVFNCVIKFNHSIDMIQLNE
jgi:hypothetical protein